MEEIGWIEHVKTEIPHRENGYPTDNKQKEG
jgi:hypothetical protein